MKIYKDLDDMNMVDGGFTGRVVKQMLRAEALEVEDKELALELLWQLDNVELISLHGPESSVSPDVLEMVADWLDDRLQNSS